ncbi:MAG TPA: pyridoxal-phosphate dependent enzyme [Saprospiraceae bacterium]|nr:pyridoxal-phosphate dependent enzyme [Saprospiraceae bacterium]
MITLDNFYTNPIPVEELIDFHTNIRVWIKRDDLIHPILSGNKWRKLKYNLIQARKDNIHTLVTKGGYYSNHIAAMSEAGKLFGFKTIGIIRGEQPANFGYTLKLAEQNEMELIFVSRKEFNAINENNFTTTTGQIDNSSFIPDGGTNELALTGCNELVNEVLDQIDFIPDFWCVSVGTGGTIAGMLQAIPDESNLLGFSALKADFLKEEVLRLAGSETNKTKLTITDRFAGNGYAKITDDLIKFINTFYDKYKIPLDPVYTGKMMYGIYQLANEGYFPVGSKILAVHTGGLQGVMGYRERGIEFVW